MSVLRNVVASVLAMVIAGPALAQDISPALMDPHPLAGVVDELRIGISAHDVDYAALPFRVGKWDLDQIEDVTFDVLFTSPDIDAFRWVGAPRPEIGATINLDGQDSLAHLGLTWQLPVFETPFYLEGTLGAAIHNGYLDGAPEGRQDFGCRVNFYQRYGVGANLSEQVTATLSYEHTSNNDWCDSNEGLSNFGLRVGWKF